MYELKKQHSNEFELRQEDEDDLIELVYTKVGKNFTVVYINNETGVLTPNDSIAGSGLSVTEEGTWKTVSYQC